jgi:hypothetical protein
MRSARRSVGLRPMCNVLLANAPRTVPEEAPMSASEKAWRSGSRELAGHDLLGCFVDAETLLRFGGRTHEVGAEGSGRDGTGGLHLRHR